MTSVVNLERDGGTARVRELDWLMLAVVCLCCLGLTMAVSVQGVQDEGAAFRAIEDQGAKLVAGLVALLVCGLAPLHMLRRHARPLFGIMLLAVLSTLLFSSAKGAKRWIDLGSITIQPVEAARLVLIILTAALIADSTLRRREFRAGFVRILAPAGLLSGALALQPDLGNALLCMMLGVSMGLAAGVPVRWFFAAALPMIPLLAVAVMARGYAVGRITSFLSDSPPYQVEQSLNAIGSGGLVGVGLGNGWMKLGYVPEARNDFVFAIIGEELGFLGGMFVLGLYTVIGYVGFRLALSMRDPFHRFVIFGCTLALCMQALVNLLVTTGLAPAKGIDLPFVSSGGTNLLAMLGAVGLIGNAARTDRVTRT